MLTPLTNMTGSVAPAADAAPAEDAVLRETAEKLEAAFLREMLDQAGLAEAFGTGGEGGSASAGDAFSGFLLDAIAEDMAAAGGLGLADRFYEQLAGEPVSANRGRRL